MRIFKKKSNAKDFDCFFSIKDEKKGIVLDYNVYITKKGLEIV